MKKKIFISVFMILVSVAMITAATMAWFTDSANAGKAEFTAGTVKIEAGRIIDVGDSESGTKLGTFLPDKVVEADQEKDIDGEYVLPERSNPDVVLNHSDDFFSLGFGGTLIVEFEHGIYEPEIVIVTEVTGGNYPEELADVYVSATGDSWDNIGTATNDGSGTYKISSLNINGNIPYVKYVKIEDATKPEEFDPRPAGNPPDGFDLKTIEITGYYAEEDNWNPGDCDTRMYFVENTGTKSINLRGKFVGEWYEFNGTNWVKWLKGNEKDVVTISLADGEDTDWKKEGDYFYFMDPIPGTYSEENADDRTVELKVKVCLAGEDTDNDYQGKRYIISTVFEAIQASNDAPHLAEGWKLDENFYKTND